MLPNNVIDAVTEGSLPGHTMKMTIDATATEHLMSVLTDLYSDRIMAWIREYATNAYDAHIEAGIQRPIEVTLPTRMSQYYRIRDYGTGLDVQAMEEIYTKYGASTKRQSNAFNGMLGLGCKSAMTYAAQYSITSVKNGIKYNVSVTRGADGVGEMTVIDSFPTTDPSGVEIVIPVKSSDLWTVQSKVAEFFQWWPEGTVLVNGKAPKRFEGREVSKNLFMVDGLERDLIVMGNVAYPVPGDGYIWETKVDRYGYSRRSFSVVYFAEMGEVTFAPSRESLQTTSNTMTTIAKARDLFKENLKKSMQAEVDAEPNHRAAIKKVRSFAYQYRDIDFGDYTYKGDTVPTKGFGAPLRMVDRLDAQGNKIPNTQPMKVVDYFHWYDANGGDTEHKRDELSLETIDRFGESMCFVVNAPKSLTTYQKTKMRRAYDAGDIPRAYLFLTHLSDKPGGKWTDGIPVIDWSVIRDFKMDNGVTASREKHDVHAADGTYANRMVPADEKIVYVSKSFFSDDRYYGPKSRDYIGYVNSKGYSFLELAANRHAKFRREHKNARTLEEFMVTIVDEYNKSLTESDKHLLSLTSEDATILGHLKATGLDIADPTVVQYVKEFDKDVRNALLKKHNNISARARHFTSLSVIETESKSVFVDYPLVSLVSSYDVAKHTKNIVEYINAVYNNKKGN